MKKPATKPIPFDATVRELWNTVLDLKAALKRARIERDNWKRLLKGSHE